MDSCSPSELHPNVMLHLRRAHDRNPGGGSLSQPTEPRTPTPRSSRLKFCFSILVLHTVIMLALHCTLLWYSESRRKSPRRLSTSMSAQALELFHQHRNVKRKRSTAEHKVCANRLALYYAPRGTMPRLEDFDFLVNAIRVWKATQHDALLLVFAEQDAPSHKPLARACRALAGCVQRPAPRELPANATVAQLVHVALASMSLVPAARCFPGAGVALYAPGPGQLGASIDSQSLFEYNAGNTTRCIDTHPYACMGFAWSM